MDKLLIAVVVRSGSQRLPNKWALPIAGIPALGLLIHRYLFCRDVRNPRFWSSLEHEFVICTSLSDDDDMIAEYAIHLGVECFRGDMHSVAMRLTTAAEVYECDYVMRLTGDNPLVDFCLIEDLINYNKGAKFDYSAIKNLPIGVSGEIFSVGLLRKIVSATNHSPQASEYLTFFVLANPGLEMRMQILEQVVSESEAEYSFGMDSRADYLFLLNVVSGIDATSCGFLDLVYAVNSLISKGQQPPRSSSRSRDELAFDFGLSSS